MNVISLDALLDKPAQLGKDGSAIRVILSEASGLPYSIARATVSVDQTTKPHYFQTSTEVYQILRGEGIMYVDKKAKQVKRGDTVIIPPQAVQWIRNIGPVPLEFLCIVSPPYNPSDEVIGEKR